MIKGTRKLINRGKKDTELRNCLLELKDVLDPVDDVCVQRSDAARSVIKWGNTQTSVIAKLMEDYAGYEADINGSTQEFSDRYRSFCAVWKDVLSEKKELNKCVSLRAKAVARVEKLQKQKAKDESKIDKENLEGGAPAPGRASKKLENALLSAQQELQEADALVDLKVLENQRELHKKLRQAYADVTRSAMDHLRREASVRERMVNIINDFPQVKGCHKGPEGKYSFEYKKYDGIATAVPDWHRGEEIKDELNNIISAKDAQSARDRAEADQILQRQVGQLKKELERRTQEHDSLLERLATEATTHMDNEREAFASSLSQKSDEFKTAVEKLKSYYEEKLRRVERELSSQLETETTSNEVNLAQLTMTFEEQMKMMKEEASGAKNDSASLKRVVTDLREDIVFRALENAKRGITDVCGALHVRNTEYLDRHAKLCRAANKELLDIMKGEVEEPDFAAKTARFAQEVARVVVCGIAVARGSPAENSLDLLPHVEQVSMSAQAVLQSLSQYAEVEAPMSPLPAPKAFKFSTGTPCSPLSRTLMPPTPFKSAICDTPPDTLSLPQHPSVAGLGEELVKELNSPNSKKHDLSMTARAVESFAESTARLEDDLLKLEDFLSVVEMREKQIECMSEETADKVTQDVDAATQQVLDAFSHIEKLREHTVKNDQERVQETNLEILDVAHDQLQKMKDLIDGAKLMRSELMTLESGEKMSSAEFSQRHETWIKGLQVLLSTCIEGAPMMIESMRSVVMKRTRHEELQVACKNISACCMQLVARSRQKVKISPLSVDRIERAGTSVVTKGHDLLAAVRSAQDVILTSNLIADYGNLSDQQAKRLTMATQVKVLKLEAQLIKEREKLGKLRWKFGDAECAEC